MLVVADVTEVVTGIGGAHHDRVIAQMRIAQGPAGVVGTAGYRKVGAEGRTRLSENGIHPIVYRSALVQVDIVERAEIRQIIGIDLSADGSQFVLELDEVLGIHRLEGVLVRHRLQSIVGIELHGNLLALVGALGRHDDDTVRTAATVDGRGEGILEDVDGLDLRRRDVIDRLDRETVHDVERAVVLGNGTTATDTDLDVGVRIAFRRNDRDARHLAGQSLAYRGYRLLGQLVTADGGNGAEQVTALNRRVTDHNDLVEEGRILLQGHIDLGSPFDGDRLVAQADEREDQVDSIGRNRNLVITVQAGDHADGGSFHEDAGAHQRFPALVRHDATDGRLGGQAPGCSHADQRKK